MGVVGVDHIAIGVEDLDAGVALYTALLGAAPRVHNGAPPGEAAVFELSNTRIVLLQPGTRRQGVCALGLAVLDTDRAALQLEAAGLACTPCERLGTWDAPVSARWALAAERTRGLALQLVQREDGTLPAARSLEADQVEALDHVVIRSSEPDAACALYGHSLGIRLALDRVFGGARMLFFRTGGVTIEVIGDASAAAADSFFGLAYRVRDLHAAHLRLEAAGFALTELRAGRKFGTHVFSVREATSGVPTLFIRDASRDSPAAPVGTRSEGS